MSVEYNTYLDLKFNRNLDKLDNLKRGIDTNEKIITDNKYKSMMMDRQIISLFYITLYFVFLFIVITLTRFNVVTPTIFIIYLLISTIAILIKIYTVYYSENTAILQAKIEATIDKINQPSDYPQTCPWTCPNAPLQGFIPVPPPAGSTLVQHELSKDYSTNKWLHGDEPDYGPIQPEYATTYKCEWNLGPRALGRKYMPPQFISTIPCHNYPGYHQSL